MADRLRQVHTPDGFVYLRPRAIESVSKPYEHTAQGGEVHAVRTVTMASGTEHVVLDTPENAHLFMEES